MFQSTKTKKLILHPKNIVLLAFGLSFLYWAYLFFTSSMVIAQDAIGYQHLGTLIQEKGWTSYFVGGPKREPLYPFLISISMHLGKFFLISYQPFQRIIQLLLLFLTQLLTLKILKKLRIRESLIILCILYIGFSPALVNSALSLYSEIATYPIVLSIVLLCGQAWSKFQTSWRSSVRIGLLCGFLFIAATFIKGIFEIISPIIAVSFAFFSIFVLPKKNPRVSINILTFLLGLLVAFYIPINLYKSLNEKYNGNFTLTDRGPWALYGNTARRMAPETIKKLPAALLYAPGEGVCKKFADENSCRYWSFYESDKLGYNMLNQLRNEGLSNKDIDRRLLDLSLKAVMKNPFQYALFATIEGLKMIFWESTKIGFVNYPKWLTALFDFTPFKDGIRLVMSLLTLFSLIFSLNYFWKHRNFEETTPLFFGILVLIITFITLHSFFFILTRYAFPIVPLYLILIAFSFDKLIPRNKTS